MTFFKLQDTAKVIIKTEVDSGTGLPQEIKITSEQSTFIPKGTRKRRTNEIQSQYKEGNYK